MADIKNTGMENEPVDDAAGVEVKIRLRNEDEEAVMDPLVGRRLYQGV
jgi:hypothetical protein